MKNKQIIKQHSRIEPENAKIAYTSKTLDYLVYETPDDLILCGAQNTSLIPYLMPGVKTQISAESSEYIKNHKSFQSVIDIFDLEENEIYYILLIRNNVEDFYTILIFPDANDCMSFQSFLSTVSLTVKTNILKDTK